MKKIAIIGAGPVGLYFASLCKKNKFDYVIFEASNRIGGQIVNLYPQKKIYDVKDFKNYNAIDLITNFKNKIDINKIHLQEKVIDINDNKVVTDKNEYLFDYIVIAIGLGVYLPRKLGLENEEKCKNILYSLNDFSFLTNKKVAIFGGGDSALDWANEISNISNDVHLIHRRLEFRGNPETIKKCTNLNVHLPYIPFLIQMKNDKCEIIKIKKVDEEKYIDIEVDYILVNYGNVPINTPFKFAHQGNFLMVDHNQRVSNNIYAIGDCCTYDNKIRRIETGKKEANIVIDDLLSLN